MRRALLAAALVLAATVLGARHASAAAPTVEEFWVDAPGGLTVGDHVVYHVILRTESGTRVTLAANGLPPQLSLVEPAKVKTSRDGDFDRVEMTITAAVFAVGDAELAPLKLRFRDSSGQTGEVQTPTSRVFVNSVLPEDGELALRDLKPQAEVGTAPAPPYLLIGLVGAIVALAIVLAAYALRRRALTRPAPFTVEPAPAPLSAEDRARQVLDEAAETIAARGDYPEGYAGLAGAVRGYLTDRFGFPAFALTTGELQTQMVSRGIERWQARLVAGLLEQCDAVVYASYRPAAERADADVTAAYEIVEMTRLAQIEEVPV